MMHTSVQQKAILDVVCSCHDHPTADVIYLRVRKILPNISLGTVYRNLKNFVLDQKIISVETTDKSIHYDGDTSPHSHFICTNCGEIIDIYENVPVPKQLEEMGVVTESQKVIYYGKCRKCK